MRFLVAGLGHRRGGPARARPRSSASTRYGTFLGWIGDDVLHSLYRIADLTVVPSLYEPFGLVALEAMASGCPCIVADTGGLREIVPADERVGLRFNGGDPEHLATMVERLLTDDALRDRLVAEASEHVLTFDWADVARQVAGALRRRAQAAARGPLKSRGPPALRSPRWRPPARRRHPRPSRRLGARRRARASPRTRCRRSATRAARATCSSWTRSSRSDRVPVVIHDADARPHHRVHRRGGRPRRSPRLRACRTDVLGSPAAAWPRARSPRREPIPTLAEVLAFARREGAFVNLEIKNQPTDPDFDPGDGFADTVMAAVSASGLPEAAADRAELLAAATSTAAKARLPGVADVVAHPRAGQRRRPGLRVRPTGTSGSRRRGRSSGDFVDRRPRRAG